MRIKKFDSNSWVWWTEGKVMNKYEYTLMTYVGTPLMSILLFGFMNQKKLYNLKK